MREQKNGPDTDHGSTPAEPTPVVPDLRALQLGELKPLLEDETPSSEGTREMV